MKRLNRIAALSWAIMTTLAGTANFSSAQIFNVKDYGATGNGSTIDTPAINNAIKAASIAGGGLVVFPAGKYLSVSIHLSNNVTLYLSNSASILGASSGYDAAESTSFSGYQDYGHSHFHDALIWGEKLHNIGIAGPGKIDGNGHLSTATTPSSGQGDKALSLKLCTGITITDVTITRGGHFGILANGCSNMVVSGAQILCSSDRDAFDLINSSDVEISDSTIQGSDDSMCLKADFALGEKLTSSHINIHNCSILSTGNNATQFGSETEGDFYDVSFSHIQIGSAGKAGIGITSNDGSIIDGVTYNDVTMVNCATPIFIKLSDQNRLPVSSPVGRIRNISLNNIRATKSIQGGVEFSSVIHGKSGIPVSSVTLSNVYLTVHGGHPTSDASIVPPDENDWRPRILGTLPAYGWYLRHVSGISFVNCKVDFDSNDGRPAVIVDDGQNVKLDTLVAAKGSSSAYDLGFSSSTTYQVTGSANTSGGALRINASSGSTTASITAPPVLSPLSDTYSDAQTVTLSTATGGAAIRYTTDDSTPTASSGTLYSGPITVDATTAIRAIASASGLVTSAVNVANYSIESTSPVQDFTLSAAPGSQSIAAGSGTSYTVTVSPLNGFGGTVNLSVSGLPTGASAGFSPASVSGGSGSSQLNISTATSTAAGTYTLTIKGTSGSLSHSITVTLTVGSGPDFTISATPGSRTVTAGSNTTYTVNVGNINAFSGTVTFSGSGLPAGAGASFNPSSVAMLGSSTMTVTTATNTPAGSSTLTITGTSGSLSHSTNVTLNVTSGSSGGALMFEAESLAVANSGVGTSLQTDVNSSGGTWVQLNATGTGNWMEFTLPNIPAGTYSLKMKYKGNTTRGQLALNVDGASPLGSILDEYSSSQTYPEQTFGTVTFSSTGNHTVRLTVTGKNSASSGFLLSADNFTLTPTTGGGGTTVAFEAESAPVTDSGVGTSLQTDANSSGGTWVQLNATAAGDWMEFTTPTITAGTYSLSMMWKGNTSRGIAGFAVDGATTGGTLDQYSASQTYPTTVIGTVTFGSAGTHKVRLTVTGKNSASSGFVLSADKFTFTAQ